MIARPEQSPEGGIEALLADASHATEQGRVEDAIALIRRCLETDPNHGVARNNLACLLLERSQVEEALEVLEHEPVEGAPVEFDSNLGYAYLRSGNVRNAERVFRRILGVFPDDLDARNHLGMALLRRDKPGEAMEQFGQVLRTDPDNVEALNNLGCARQSQGDLAGAELAFERALQVDPYSVDAHNNNGCVLREQGRLEDAIDELTVAVQLEPKNPMVHLNLALSYRRLGKKRKALSHLRQHLRHGPALGEFAELHHILRELEHDEEQA